MLSKIVKSWPVKIGIILCLLYGGMRAYFNLTDDFRISNITYEVPYNSSWEVSLKSKEEKDHLNEILQQKFYYIGKGAQSYAFASEDGNYVLKFIKFKHLKPSFWVETFSFLPQVEKYRAKQSKRKNKLLNSVFDGYHLAFERHKEESGLIFVHLNMTMGQYSSVTLIDKLGLKRTIPLDQIVFFVQEKVKTTRIVFDQLLKEGNLPLAKQRIGQIFSLYGQEYKKGIYDRDHGIMHNTGFAGERPIHLDVGKLTEDPRMKETKFAKEDFEKVLVRFNAWIKNNYPQYYNELSETIEKEKANIFS